MYYVYALCDPRTNTVFYIGKGQGDRVFSHELDAESNEQNTEKLEKLRALAKEGLRVNRIIVHYGLSEKEAFAAESALINFVKKFSTGHLANQIAGHNADVAMSVEEFEVKYGSPELELFYLPSQVLVIKVNQKFNWEMSASELKEIVRGHWVLNPKKASQSKLLLAVYCGLVIGVYENLFWFSSATITEFYPRKEDFCETYSKRYYCTCDAVSSDSKYGKNILHHRLPEATVLSQNPVSYLYNRTHPMQKYLNAFLHPQGVASNFFEIDMQETMFALGYMDLWDDATENSMIEVLFCDNAHSYKEIISAANSRWCKAIVSFSHRQITHWEETSLLDFQDFFITILYRIILLDQYHEIDSDVQ